MTGYDVWNTSCRLDHGRGQPCQGHKANGPAIRFGSKAEAEEWIAELKERFGATDDYEVRPR